MKEESRQGTGPSLSKSKELLRKMEVILYILILCLDQARQKAFDDSYGMY